MTIITVEYLKQKFSEGCTIKQIALENFMSPSTVSHTIKRYEKDGFNSNGGSSGGFASVVLCLLQSYRKRKVYR